MVVMVYTVYKISFFRWINVEVQILYYADVENLETSGENNLRLEKRIRQRNQKHLHLLRHVCEWVYLDIIVI